MQLAKLQSYQLTDYLTIKKIAILNFASTPTLYTTNNQYITPNFATLQTLQVPISHKTKFSFPKIGRQFFNYSIGIQQNTKLYFKTEMKIKKVIPT